MTEIIIHNKRICNFYQTNTFISFEEVNLFMVDLLEKMIQNTEPSLDKPLAIKLLEQMAKSQTDTVKSHQNIHTLFQEKMVEFKKDYNKELTNIVSNNNTETLGPLIRQYNLSLEDKIKLWMHETIPKTNDSLYKDISSSLKELYQNIQKDTKTLLDSSLDKKILEDFVQSIDNKFAKSLVSSQTFLNTMITSTEQRLSKSIVDSQVQTMDRLKSVEKNITVTQLEQTALQQNVGELLRKLENSSAKGKISENLLQHVLHNAYPSGQIESVGTSKETGDFMLSRQGKTTILFENKNYERNVGQEEVKKFIRDIELQECSGILCAQHYGISNKENYQIDVHNGHILVYLHKVEYDPDKIKAAVDIIDHFLSIMEDLDFGNEIVQLEKKTLDDINKEYQQFIQSKLTQVKLIKEYNQKLISQLDDWKLPQLEHLLLKFFSTTAAKENVCEYCQYIAKNPRALVAHKRGCVEKKKISATQFET